MYQVMSQHVWEAVQCVLSVPLGTVLLSGNLHISPGNVPRRLVQELSFPLAGGAVAAANQFVVLNVALDIPANWRTVFN